MRLSPSRAALRAALVAAAMAWAGEAPATDAGTPDVTPGKGLTVTVPSGQSVTLQDVIWNVPGTDGMATRFRFIAPDCQSGSKAACALRFDARSSAFASRPRALVVPSWQPT